MRALLPQTLALMLGAMCSAQHTASNAASSQSYFLSAVEFASGSDSNTLLYRVQSSQGTGVVTEPDAASATYRIRGGFTGALTSPVLGQPWLTGVLPYYVKPSGNGNLTLHGTELWLGPSPLITVGGLAATNVVRTVDKMVIAMPTQPVPGYQPVTFTNAAGTSTLPEGVGVLPLVEKREPLNGFDPNFVRFRAQQGDFVVLVVGLALSAPLQVLDFQYQLLLDPNQVTLTDLLFVGNPDGTITIPLFGFPTGIAHVQVLALTTDPAYAPGMWSNVVLL